MNGNIDRIKELALTGLSYQETAERMRNLRPDTVRIYFGKAVAGMSPDERARMEKARNEKAANGGNVNKRPFAMRHSISPEHIRIGRKLLARRLADEMNLGDFAARFDFSNRVTLSAMEQGYHDFTMTEIRRIAEILDTTIEDLLCPPPGALTV